MLIRQEKPGDEAAIRTLLFACFETPAEADLVDRLRDAGHATFSLIAEADGAIIGHVLLSPVAAVFPALALAPLAVANRHRGQGLAAVLVREAIWMAKTMGWRAIFVLGEPAYYRRFGFSAELAAGFASPYAGPHLMALPLGGDLPAKAGKIHHAPAFADLD